MRNTPSGTVIIGEHLAAVNAFDTERIVETFAEDALVNDAHREFWGLAAIKAWVAKELVGDKVTVNVVEVIDHDGITIVRGRYEGQHDKTNLPAELVLTNYSPSSTERSRPSSSSAIPQSINASTPPPGQAVNRRPKTRHLPGEPFPTSPPSTGNGRAISSRTG